MIWVIQRVFIFLSVYLVIRPIGLNGKLAIIKGVS